ncbi:MAG: CHAT domain-containing protein [Chitinophagales bacterium]|nr:CHAT domain-containing protein [Chitinophagales bacterium]
MRIIVLLCISWVPIMLFSQSPVEHQIDSLISLVRDRMENGKLEQALEVNTTAKQLLASLPEKETYAHARVMANFGRLLYLQGDMNVAESNMLEAKRIYWIHAKEEQTEYLLNLDYLGELYMVNGAFNKAGEIYQEIKNAREKRLGIYHPEYAKTLNHLGLYYTRTAQYDAAEAAFMEALPILEKDKAGYTKVLINLGILYRTIGWYDEAELIYLKAKSIFENELKDTGGRNYVSCVGNLANLYYIKADFVRADALYEEDLKLRAKVFGKKSPQYALSLSNRASFFNQLGNYKKSEALYLECINLWASLEGDNSFYYSYSMGNLADLYLTMKEFEKAESLYHKSLSILESTVGTSHDAYADILNLLAVFYQATGDYEKAESLFLDALNIRGKVLGKKHYRYALILQSLAGLYADTDRYAKSEHYYLEALGIVRNTFGTHVNQYTNCLNELALLYYHQEDYSSAATLYIELANLNRQLISNAHFYLSEEELELYLAQFLSSHEEVVAFTQAVYEQKETSVASMAASCYDNCLFYKGFLLHSIQQLRRLLCTDETTYAQFNQIRSLHKQLGNELTLPIEERDSIQMKCLKERANILEKELARNLTDYEFASRQPDWKNVQSQLKDKEAAVEFVRYHSFDTDSAACVMYAALILKPGEPAPLFIPLTEERMLLQLMESLATNTEDLVKKIYAFSSNNYSLYHLIWEPLEKELENCEVIYYSPDGLLHRLNFDAVQSEKAGRLCEQYRFVCLGSTRQLAVQEPDAFLENESDALLYGGIKYELDSTNLFSIDDNNRNKELSVSSKNGLKRSKSVNFDRLDGISIATNKWDYLQWTAIEIESIKILLENAGVNAITVKGDAATEDSFKMLGENVDAPGIIHLATHGFFFSDPIKETNRALAFKSSTNPMIRSGLIMAGANYAWNTGKPYKYGVEDGILTAYEISQLDLSNTGLVVLSACETGLGAIRGNEGVYGLQRAFKIAGVKYIIMSLWQVPDFQTEELMTSFYYNWLNDSKSIPEAFRKAQASIREKYPDPFYWAGFVLVQ